MMRLVHLSDLHLGYRAYNRVNTAGLNQREADVFRVFREALGKVVELQPDLVLIAGDMFHVVRPSNLTIQHTFRELAGLVGKLEVPIVIIGGNHDSPRSADTGCILDILTNLPGIHVAHSEYVQVKLDNLDTSVFCLSHRALPDVTNFKIEPDPSSKRNVLLAHGTVEGVIKQAGDIYQLSPSQVIKDDWDYIAFGHYHSYTQLAENAYYSGSLEYTSSNIWSEIKTPKGFIEYDLDDRKLVNFHKSQPRDVIDIRPIDATGLTADELNTMIANRIEGVEGGHRNKIIRLIIDNIPRSVQVDLDFEFIRTIRSEALHFDFQTRSPLRSKRLQDKSGPTVSRSLEDEWDDFVKAYDMPGGVDREALRNLGRDYINKQSGE
ncbi:MAG: metallophosphoesterase family protein [Armatimonadota bacterium]|jgi:exonuclease SbcD